MSGSTPRAKLTLHVVEQYVLSRDSHHRPAAAKANLWIHQLQLHRRLHLDNHRVSVDLTRWQMLEVIAVSSYVYRRETSRGRWTDT